MRTYNAHPYQCTGFAMCSSWKIAKTCNEKCDFGAWLLKDLGDKICKIIMCEQASIVDFHGPNQAFLHEYTIIEPLGPIRFCFHKYLLEWKSDNPKFLNISSKCRNISWVCLSKSPNSSEWLPHWNPPLRKLLLSSSSLSSSQSSPWFPGELKPGPKNPKWPCPPLPGNLK